MLLSHLLPSRVSSCWSRMAVAPTWTSNRPSDAREYGGRIEAQRECAQLTFLPRLGQVCWRLLPSGPCPND